jgi:carbon storage regulator
MEINMLILTRQIGESIIIGDDIEIKLIGISKNVAKIGIDANMDVPIFREELYKKIQKGLIKDPSK